MLVIEPPGSYFLLGLGPGLLDYECEGARVCMTLFQASCALLSSTLDFSHAIQLVLEKALQLPFS